MTNLEITARITSVEPICFKVDSTKLAIDSTVTMYFSRTEDLKYELEATRTDENLSLRSVYDRLGKMIDFIETISTNTRSTISSKTWSGPNGGNMNFWIEVEVLD